MPTQPNAGPEPDNVLVTTAVRTGYNEQGVEIDPDSTDCVAKSSKDIASGNTRYWIRAHKFGTNAGHYYNPQGVFASRKREKSIAGLSAYAWVAAKPEAFDNYLRFLTTGNIICLRKAERA